MKIICIGRNYSAHVKELKNDAPEEPVFFLKPDTALLKPGEDFFHPEFTSNIHHEVELVLKISKAGKHIQEQFAHKYYEEIGIGIDFTARDLQDICKTKGLPWEKAKAFDGSAPIGKFLPKSQFTDLRNISFYLNINGERRQSGNSGDMQFHFHHIIAYISQFITLKTGDLIFTGTPAGVGPVHVGDTLEAGIGNESLFSLTIK